MCSFVSDFSHSAHLRFYICHRVYQYFISFYCQVEFHCMDTPNCVYSFTYQGHLGCFKVQAIKNMLYMFMYKTLYGYIFSFLLDKDLDMGCMCQIIVKHLTFPGNCQLYIQSAVLKNSNFSASSQSTCFVSLFNFSHPLSQELSNDIECFKHKLTGY